MTSPIQELEVLMSAAIEAAEKPYLLAIAAELDGAESPDEHWRAFNISTARAFLLSMLVGIAAETARAKSLGANLQTDDQEPLAPIRFAKHDEIDLGKSGKIKVAALAEFMSRLDEDFIAGPFLEALRGLEDRIPRLAHHVRELQGRAKDIATGITSLERTEGLQKLTGQSKALSEAIRRSFWVSDVDLSTTININQLVGDQIRGVANIPPLNPKNKVQGGLVPFIDKSQLEGAGNLTRARLETVYRTNLSQAYNDGRTVALRGPEVKKHMPVVMIVEFRDQRARPTHKRMNGYINTLEFLESRGLIPPNGFNCRGGIRGVPRRELRRKGLLDPDGNVDPVKLAAYNGPRQALIDSGVYPDPDFVNSAA